MSTREVLKLLGQAFIALAGTWLAIAMVYYFFMGVIIFIFSPSEEAINYDVLQDIGGAILVDGMERDSYEFCEYDIDLSYFPNKNTSKSKIGNIKGVIRNTKICDKMAVYGSGKKSIYSKLQIRRDLQYYYLNFNDGENPPYEFKSDDLLSWDKVNQ